jgi:uracil phosphoribosyltransferase
VKVKVVEGALKEELLRVLRDRRTGIARFKEALRRLGLMLISEALTELKLREVSLETPVAPGVFKEVAQEVVFLPILRAGLSLLAPAVELYPQARVGFIGVYRDEERLTPVPYYLKFPLIEGAKYLILDPMVATGGTAEFTVNLLLEKGISPEEVVLASVICAPEGIERLKKFKGLNLITAQVDERLNDRGYIVPGLGDAGDRFCGTEGVEVIESYGV